MTGISPISSRVDLKASVSNPVKSTAMDFNRLFQKELGAGESTGSRKAETREAAVQLVSSAFIKPILAQLRESRSTDGPFAPGPAEKRFGPLLDERVADQLVEASNFNLIDVIADRFMAPGNRGVNHVG